MRLAELQSPDNAYKAVDHPVELRGRPIIEIIIFRYIRCNELSICSERNLFRHTEIIDV